MKISIRCAIIFLTFHCCVFSAEDRIASENVAGIDEGLFRAKPSEKLDLNEKGLIAFSAARSKPLKGHKQKQFALEYDHVFLNQGNQFDAKSGTFTALTSGVYEFTFTGGALRHRKLSLQLMKNHFEVQTLAFDGHKKKNPNVQSQTILLELEPGDRIWIRLAASRDYGVVGTNGHGYVTTFTGRLLSTNERKKAAVDGLSLLNIDSQPLSDTNSESRDKLDLTSSEQKSRAKRSLNGAWRENNQIAFSVARTSCVMGQSFNHSRVYPIKKGAITFDKSFVNLGKSLNLGTGEFTAPVSGLYFFSFTVGKYPRKKLSVSMIKNENEFQVMVYDESRSNKRQMQSQSLILDLKAGDKIWLKSYDSDEYAVYSNLGNYITFNGYLLNTS